MSRSPVGGTELMPDIRLVPVDAVAFHEQPEAARTRRLMARIRDDAFLRNPPIVADMGEHGYLLLDGANRVSAFRELGHARIPVQIVDYADERIQLKAWHHLVLRGRSLDLHGLYGAMDQVDLRPVRAAALSNLLEFRQVFGILVDSDTAMWGLFPRGTAVMSVQDRNAVLHRIVAAYEGRSDLERIKLSDFSLLPDVVRTVEHQLVLFPAFTKEELLLLAQQRAMIPTGITRHLIPGRALGLNLDLAFLREMSTEAAQQAHLQRFLEQLELHGRIRFYEESIFVMNE